MQSRTLRFTRGFRLAIHNRRGQAAEMVIPRGDAEGGPDNAHRGADQWLFVLDGRGVAIVEGRRTRLKAGTLILIEKGERHEIRNTGTTHLRTLVFYTPPAYRTPDARLPRGKP
ncbi:cupin domain-containing protein [Dokdonella fugitiva]|jgi:mannose-6-phosphate isomerase-like protein (cupin superfamily)|uniref:Mannose-6-phosphate isomerase-like protein (Cupin superfamily) n=1 Tax=Dokdonella fugitiva TaxID=328517 RepID=A0A4R2I6S7_9GAMM|nr:cupin domain-containing protein [Dokdonella fugitiva]MBA8884388.1 mannose-6-phosphate isomerase-like protein (cupin superfamily) [Dokdonella fugitiva]TCO39993.1 mannose-6-phosphate isomerase-like protein (cupin superfamily) [Dokdonella fugitiva]